MAIVTTRSTALAQTLSIDPALLQTPAAQRARQKGILLAKQQALRAAAGLLAWGRLLTWAICFVSALHIWETVAAIAPPAVPPLKLDPAIYHGAALAFTLLIDACAIYIAKANATSAFAGAPPSRWTLFFYTVTALLNAAFVARYAPAIDPATQQQLLPLLAGLFVGLLPLSIPAGIVAVETANRTLEATRLTLLVEVTILRELHDDGADADVAAAPVSCQNAAAPVVAASRDLLTDAPLAPSGGRTTEFVAAHVVQAFAAAPDAARSFRPQDVQAQLGCSETTAHRLIREALATGAIVRVGRGSYQVCAA
jgi:hypothetical protein